MERVVKDGAKALTYATGRAELPFTKTKANLKAAGSETGGNSEFSVANSKFERQFHM